MIYTYGFCSFIQNSILKFSSRTNDMKHEMKKNCAWFDWRRQYWLRWWWQLFFDAQNANGSSSAVNPFHNTKDDLFFPYVCCYCVQMKWSHYTVFHYKVGELSNWTNVMTHKRVTTVVVLKLTIVVHGIQTLFFVLWIRAVHLFDAILRFINKMFKFYSNRKVKCGEWDVVIVIFIHSFCKENTNSVFFTLEFNSKIQFYVHMLEIESLLLNFSTCVVKLFSISINRCFILFLLPEHLLSLSKYRCHVFVLLCPLTGVSIELRLTNNCYFSWNDDD